MSKRKAQLKIEILTLFPEFFASFLEWSMIKKAITAKALKVKVHNLRNWAIDKRGTVDDTPYGGGPGMILRVEPVFKALKKLKKRNSTVIFFSPKGKVFNQKKALCLSRKKHLIFLCGHYEGIDERIRKHLIDEEISIGNFVLSGGELPALVLTDAVSRLLPGVLEKKGASEVESFSPGLSKLAKKTNQKLEKTNPLLLTEYPHYTKPPKFQNWKVPKILLSGHHRKIELWRGKKIKVKK